MKRINAYRRILIAVLALGAVQVVAAHAGSLHVRRISPAGVNVQPGQELVIQFDRHMVALGDMALGAEHLPVRVRPDPGCLWRWLDSSELACRLPGKRRFAPATRYSVRIGTTLTAVDGSHLARPFTQHFSTWRPQVLWSRFQHWQSPQTPVYLLRFNLRVTRAGVARTVYFDGGHGKQVAARAVPFTTRRKGPLWLPVPGAPGAVIEVDHVQPDTPLDARARAAAGRRVWQVVPARPLVADHAYHLRSRPGLTSPSGPLPGQQTDLPGYTGLRTYGALAVTGVACRDHDGHALHIAAGAAARAAGRCRPDSVNLLFSAPVPRATLRAIRWSPTPLPAARLAQVWKDYPQWFLRPRSSPDAAGSPASYPLTFKLQAMHDYVLHVPAGVSDVFGRRLASAVRVNVRSGHYTPFLDAPPAQAVLEAGEATIAPLRFGNLDTLQLDYRRLFAADLDGRRPRGSSRRQDLLRRPDLDVAPDRVVRGRLGVRQLLDGRSGVLWGSLDWSPNGPSRPRAVMAEVTPYQVLAKVGHFDTLVWVSDLASGQPVADVRVGIYRGPDDGLAGLAPVAGATARTDARGLAVLPGTVRLQPDWFQPWKHHVRFFVGAHAGDSMALLPLDFRFARSVGDASHYTLFARNAPAFGHMRAWAVTEQGIYKPGSDVRFAAFVRNQGRTTLEPPPALDYTLTVTDPRGNVVLRREHVKLSAYGGVDGHLHVPATAATGWYDIGLSWPTATGIAQRRAGRFMVTDFVPARFKVQTLLQGERFAPGQILRAQVSAHLHAGGPYGDAAVRYTTRLLPRRFDPRSPVAAGFLFGRDADASMPARTLAQTRGHLDATGSAHTRLTLPAGTGITYGRVQVEAAVRSARATWVAASAHAVFAARDRFVGLRTAQWLQTAGKPFRVQYLVVDAGGHPQAGSALRLVLQRREVSRVRVKNAAGDFTPQQRTRWHDVDHCRAMSGKTPGACALTPDRAGSYRVLATVTDTRGRVQHSVMETWVTGRGGVVWKQGKGVTLVPDKDRYQVGDTAHILVQNPYPGARALITVERFGVLWKHVVTLAGGAPVIDVPIGADCFPGAYVSVAIFSPRVSPPADPDLGRPQLALGYMPLIVTGHGSALRVQVTPDAVQHKPREPVDVSVRVRTADGHAAAHTRLVAAVVDQSVLDLLRHGVGYYNPLRTFYAPPDGPDVSNYSLAEQLLTRLQPKQGKGISPGGGGGGSTGPDVRSQFSYATYWNATLRTDAAGRAHFRFRLPDNLTRWRILVIALRPGAAMGLGDASVRVNLPLQIQPALPSQVHVGDRFGAAFNVTNRTDSAREVHTHLEASGAIAGGHAAADGGLTLAPWAHGLRWLQLAASAPGRISVQARVRAGTLGDAVRAHIPVRRAGAEVVAAAYGSTTGRAAQVPVKVPATALPGSARVQVRLAPTLLGGLDGAFESLRDDPLQTWEIRLSRGVLAADYLKLAPQVGAAVSWPQAGAELRAMLDAAADFQAPDGGMAFWVPRNRFVSPYLSAYTALAFNWLAAAGHAPPPTVSAHLHAYLRKHVLDGNAGPGDSDGRVAPVLRAAAMDALAAGGTLPTGAVAGMLPQLPRLDLFGRALLLDAALRMHDHASARHIVKAILAQAEESAGEMSFNQDQPGAYVDLLGTPLRANCAVLDALSRYHREIGDRGLLGSTPQKLMRWVMRQRRNAGGWPNSQENVFCTTAIAHYVDAYEPPVRALEATVEVPGRRPRHARFASRRAPGVRLSGPAVTPGRMFRVDVGRSGRGRLYYDVRLSYAMAADALPPADAGFTIRRRYAVQRGRRWQPVTADTVLRRGDIVRVALDVDAPTERHFVVVTDPLPGAFEAVNRDLATAVQTLPSAQPGVAVLMFDAGAWPNMSVVEGGFYHRRIGLDAVRFYADDLPAGHYRLVYSAQVVAPGHFIAPAAQVKQIYQPDVFARGRPQHLHVDRSGP